MKIFYNVRQSFSLRLIAFLLLLFPFKGFSQLQVTPGGTAATIINALVGGGLTVSNVTINCGATAYGTFNGSASNIGLNNGILLTTGDASLAIGPNNQAGAGYCWNFAAGAPDPQLTTVEANAVYDLCVLEFDVVPHCSNMTMRFVWASEEYPEYVSSNVNDAFGFFITGPSSDCSNPLGYLDSNVARLPNGDPVSIDSINTGNWACPGPPTGCHNCAYYVDNCGGATVQYDGFTIPITVTLNVCPCATYHWKFAIADAGDCVWDSGVFIDYLQCTAPFTYNVNTTNATCTCDGAAYVNITSGSPPYSYNWTPSGQTGATATGLCAGNYTVSVTDVNSCNIPVVQTFTINSASSLNVGTATTDVTCFNQSNGSASANAAGGNGPYTYSWNTSPIQTTQSATGLSAGTYTVTVTDASGCSVINTVSITQPIAVTAIGSPVTNISCYNGNNGSVTVTPGGGSGVYSYQWSPSAQTTITANNLSAGSYTVTVTDGNNCTATSTTTITQPPILTGVGSTVSNVSCFNGNNGSVSVTPGGGTGAYTYLWNPSGSTAQTATSLSSGGYTVTITDANGCTISAIANVTQPLVLTGVGSTVANVSCYNGANGSARVMPGGGTGPYTYTWSPSGGSSQTASNLTAGTYTVTVTDANGCTVSSTAVVNQPTQLAAAGALISNVSCYNGNNGSVTVTPGGGTGTYTYSWTPSGGTTQTATNLIAGSYTVVVTDANGCTISSTASVTQPPLFTAAGSTITNVSCYNGSNGSASVTPAGGSGTYTYSWSPTGGTAQTASNLNAGTYTIIVTDANNCTATSTSTITQPTLLTAAGAAVANVTCFNANNGSVTVTPGGGTGSYTYSWTPSGETTQTATNLSAGTYTVTVTDVNGCTASSTASATQPAALSSVGSTVANVTCYNGTNGSTTVNSAGGTIPYTYSWSPSGGTVQTATGLPVGNYTVSVTDANGCVTSASASITQPTILTANASTLSNIACSSSSSGVAEVNAGGGVGTYTYLWSPSGGTNATASNLGGGTFTVTVTDANGCSQTATTTVSQTNPVVVNIPTTANVSCYSASDGQAISNVSGGSGPGTYSYSWLPSGGTNATAIGLSAGNYTLSVTDANGCTEVAYTSITQPTQVMSVIPSSTNVSCNGGTDGSAIVNAAGGTGTYSYLWIPSGGTSATAVNLSAGAYTVTVTDANGCATSSSVTITEPAILSSAINTSVNLTCNGDNSGSASVNVGGGTGPYTYSWLPSGGTTATANNLAAGTYTIAITDSHGCLTFTTTVITEPAIVTSSINNSVNVSCAGGSDGSASVMAGGGIPPYNYSWLPSGGNGPIASNLSAGAYTVTVTDNNGCISSTNITITEPTPVTASISSQTNVSCNGQPDGSASVMAGGGTGGYYYYWSPSGGNAATANNLSAGLYTITVSDGNNCSQTATVTITEPLALTAVIPGSANVSCHGGNNGSASVNASGGTGPYTYSWLPSGGTTNTANNLSAGTYTIGVADAHGCVTATSVVITEPAQLTSLISSSTNNLCNGNTGGSATVSVNGGTPSYLYQWSPSGGTDSTAGNLAAGTYTVNITDINGCTSMQSVIITEPTLLTFTVNTPATICQAQDATISASANGGTSPYTYVWDNGYNGSSQVVSPTVTSIYNVTVTDANGCNAASQSVTVNVYPVLNVNPAAPSSVCANQMAIFYTTGGGGNGGPYTYTWSNGSTGVTVPVVITQDTTLTVTINDGCSPPVQQSVSVIANPVPQVNFSPQTIQGCAPLTVDFTDSSIASAGSMYVWDLGNGGISNEQNFSYTYTEPGIYNIALTVTTPQNCTNSFTAQQAVEVFNLPEANFVTSNPVVDILEPNVDFTNYSTDASTWQWNFGDSTLDSTIFNPSHMYSDTGTYTIMLAVQTVNGCTDTVYRRIKVTAEYALFIPNSFSPNGDGKNDKFAAFGSWIIKYNLVILDRWGAVIFHTDNINEAWDGTYQENGNQCQSDVYVYKITATGPDHRAHQFVGHVTLWR